MHPSTVSRAVANKYAHTPQGVIELRFFFSEGSNGPEGADTPLLLLKRKVRKLIDDEDPKRPAHRRSACGQVAGAGHPADPSHGGKIPRGYEYSFDAPAAQARRVRLIRAERSQGALKPCFRLGQGSSGMVRCGA